MKNLKFSLIIAFIIPLVINAVVFENQSGETIAIRIKEANDNIIRDITHLDAKPGILSTTKIDIGDARKYQLPFKIRIWLKKQFESAKKGEKGQEGHGLLLDVHDLKKDEEIYFDKLSKKGSPNLVKIIYDNKSDKFYLVYKAGQEVKEYIQDVESYLKMKQKEKEKRATVQPVEKPILRPEYANVPQRGSTYHSTPEYVEETSYAKTPVSKGKEEITEYANVPGQSRSRSHAVTQKASEQRKSIMFDSKPQDLP